MAATTSSTRIEEDGHESITLNDGRIIYLHERNKSPHWEPPWSFWRCRLGLPYAWEQAIDNDGNSYFINHLKRCTTFTDPRTLKPSEGNRDITLIRDESIGFGFVAAGQKPTMIQFVSPNGPSDGLLYSNDQIIEVNGVNVENETKDAVVSMVRNTKSVLNITVNQLPAKPKSSRKNFKVRFTDRVMIAEHPETDCPPSYPNVLRIHLENGQIRSFKHDSDTSVQDLIDKICEKLQIKATKYFSIVLECSLGARSNRIRLLRPEYKITTVLEMPNSNHIRFLFRLTFIPNDAYELFMEDVKAFDYYYQQCVNDVLRGRFSMEIRYEACVRLAALQIQQVAINCHILKNHKKVSLRQVEKEYGLGAFLPLVVIENVKRGDIRNHIRFYLKKDKYINQEIDNIHPSSEESRLKCIRLKYISIVSHLPSFGGRTFYVTLKPSQIDVFVQIDPRNGIVIRNPGKNNNNRPSVAIGFDFVQNVSVSRQTDIVSTFIIRIFDQEDYMLELLVDKDEVDDLLMYIKGYHQLRCQKELNCCINDSPPKVKNLPTKAPPYYSIHRVVQSDWNYSEDKNYLYENRRLNTTLDLNTLIKTNTDKTDSSPHLFEIQYNSAANNIPSSDNLNTSSDTEESSFTSSLSSPCQSANSVEAKTNDQLIMLTPSKKNLEKLIINFDDELDLTSTQSTGDLMRK